MTQEHAMGANIIPTGRQLGALIIGGAFGLALWEVSARLLAPQIIGGPMEPAGLIISLFKAVFGLTLTTTIAETIHIATGLVGYPIGYWVFTRIISLGTALNGLVWGVILWFVALGVFASLAGFPFLLGYGNLTWLSLMGHVLYGYGLATMFRDVAGR
ncbi:MAG: hypothetical protein AAGG99_07680 [Pseudomonadota bacterium]